MTIATEAGHWYTRTGEPMYEVPNKSKGGMRPTTVRDARKLALVPSVTTVMNVAAKPGLEVWKQKQILLAALTLPQVEGESLDTYADRVVRDSQEQARAARDRGAEIHGILEKFFKGELTGSQARQYADFIDPVCDELCHAFGELVWTAEASFSHPLGYGGKCDLHNHIAVGDFKTKEFAEDATKLAYDDHAIQLAAYRAGLGLGTATMFNLFISTSIPGLVRLHIWDERNWLERFEARLNLWKVEKGYDPAF